MGNCMSSSRGDDRFDELNLGYRHHETREWISTREPRMCSYATNTHRGIIDYQTPLGEVKKREKEGYRSIPVEERGITYFQLKAIWELVKRRCVEESWVCPHTKEVLTPEKVNLYHVNEYVIMPYTENSKKSFVETLPSTAGTQPPRWFVSHWWGEPIHEFLQCVEVHMDDFCVNRDSNEDARGGGMTEDTPIWICAYANNQHELGLDTLKVEETPFVKALKVAQFRTLAMMDREANLLTRIWCILELYMTLVSPERKVRNYGGGMVDTGGVWAVYTAKKHQHHYKGVRQSVGIIPGGVTEDVGLQTNITNREMHFPKDLIKSTLSIEVERGEATQEADRRSILNYIIDPKGDPKINPPIAHPKYDELNIAVGSNFARTPAILQSGLTHNDEEMWKTALDLMSKCKRIFPVEFNFQFGWPNLTPESLTELIEHIPLATESLVVTRCYYGPTLIDSLIEWIGKSTSLKTLEIRLFTIGGIDGGGRDAGVRLARALAEKNTVENLVLYGTDLVGSRNAEDWGWSIAEMTSLKVLRFIGLGYDIEEVDKRRRIEEDIKLGNLDEKDVNVKDRFPPPDENSNITNLSHSKQNVYYDLEESVFPDGMLLDIGCEKLFKSLEHLAAEGENAALVRTDFQFHGYSAMRGIKAFESALDANHDIKEANLWEEGKHEYWIKKALKKLKNEDLYDRNSPIMITAL